MEINISELRKQRRPLWMTEFDEECAADVLGGGGDVYSDRVSADATRYAGEETPDIEAQTLLEGRYVEEDYIS